VSHEATEDAGKLRARWRYLVLVLDFLFSTAWEHVEPSAGAAMRRS